MASSSAAHLRTLQAAQVAHLAAEALVRQVNGGRRGACFGVKRSKRFKKFDRSCAHRGGKIAHGAAPAAEAEENQQPDGKEAAPQKPDRRAARVEPIRARLAVKRFVPINVVTVARIQAH